MRALALDLHLQTDSSETVRLNPKRAHRELLNERIFEQAPLVCPFVLSLTRVKTTLRSRLAAYKAYVHQLGLSWTQKRGCALPSARLRPADRLRDSARLRRLVATQLCA